MEDTITLLIAFSYFWSEHKEEMLSALQMIFTGASSLVFIASLAAKLTDTEVDDNFIGKCIKFLDKLALNNKPTEIKKRQ